MDSITPHCVAVSINNGVFTAEIVTDPAAGSALKMQFTSMYSLYSLEPTWQILMIIFTFGLREVVINS